VTRPTILDHFETLTDPRMARTRRHELTDIVIIAILAVICGAEGWEDIEDYAEVRLAWLKTFLSLPSGAPSADTFRRVLSALDPQEFHRCFASWMAELANGTAGKLVAIDGKTMRRSFARERGQGPMHVVSAWVAENGLSLGQLATAEKSNEIVAIPQLLALLDVRGATVTIDALGCQKKIAQAIVEGEADYILGLKANQPLLHDEVKSFFADAEKDAFCNTPHTFAETVDGEHGRIETRRIWSTSALDWMSQLKAWMGLRSLVMVERQRTVGEQTSVERSYFLSSHELPASRFGELIRAHWSIENSLHWVLDVVFDEDQSRIRRGHGAHNFALLRKLALGLLKQECSDPRMSLARKRKRAGWDHDYLFKVLETLRTTGT
jgi:predicted transposase YbfD/YdcC